MDEEHSEAVELKTSDTKGSHHGNNSLQDGGSQALKDDTSSVSSEDGLRSRSQSPECGAVETERKHGCQLFLMLIGLSAVPFASFISMFILATFFLDVCELRGVTGIQGGAIIGMVQCVFLVMSYIFLGLVHKKPMKIQIVFGLFIASICMVIFAFLERIPNNAVFVILCLLVRATQGTCVAVIDVCCFIVANKASPPEKLSTVIGYIELCVALAQAVAPAIGGYLYQIGGYYTPFLATAGLFLFTIVLVIPTVPMKVDFEKKYVSELVRDSFKIQPFFAQFLIFGGFLGFFSGMIEPHLRQFHLSPFEVGLVIFVTNAFSGFMFPVWGYVCDTLLKPEYVTLINCAIGAVGFILFGPLPGLPIQEELWIIIVSLAISGIALAGVIIASYAQCRARLGKVCRNEEIADTVISASYIAGYNFGSFLGALLGGLFIDYLGFGNGSIVMLALEAIGVLVQFYIMWQDRTQSS